MKSKTLNVRLTLEEYAFLESFSGKSKAEILRRALRKYRTKVETIRKYKRN